MAVEDLYRELEDDEASLVSVESVGPYLMGKTSKCRAVWRKTEYGSSLHSLFVMVLLSLDSNEMILSYALSVDMEKTFNKEEEILETSFAAPSEALSNGSGSRLTLRGRIPKVLLKLSELVPHS